MALDSSEIFKNGHGTSPSCEGWIGCRRPGGTGAQPDGGHGTGDPNGPTSVDGGNAHSPGPGGPWYKMFELLAGSRKAFCHVRLGLSFWSDLLWWLTFAEAWNGVALIQTHPRVTIYDLMPQAALVVGQWNPSLNGGFSFNGLRLTNTNRAA